MMLLLTDDRVLGPALRGRTTGEIFSAPFRVCQGHAMLLLHFELLPDDFESGWVTRSQNFVEYPRCFFVAIDGIQRRRADGRVF